MRSRAKMDVTLLYQTVGSVNQYSRREAKAQHITAVRPLGLWPLLDFGKAELMLDDFPAAARIFMVYWILRNFVIHPVASKSFIVSK